MFKRRRRRRLIACTPSYGRHFGRLHTRGAAASFGMLILVLCSACSNLRSNYRTSPCGDLPQPGIIAKFDPSSMISPGDRVTGVKICESGRCGTSSYDYPPKPSSYPDQYVGIFHGSSLAIKGLSIAILENGRALRTARAPGVLNILQFPHASDSCGNRGVIVRYDPRSKTLYGTKLPPAGS